MKMFYTFTIGIEDPKPKQYEEFKKVRYDVVID